ncbi:hypothetical protein [Sandaracinus amylolyticus]|uniref:hypothetical protein n=1 Tax=Sandaracinus amylolyticus TaxID=927083 RepID=UPI001F3C79E8|nr:hypothetical protein [Sandaracinus amylolyticus]UJR84471.1 Hypothetical protein I5071_65500 [Sandaracinus amylolyticus]
MSTRSSLAVALAVVASGCVGSIGGEPDAGASTLDPSDASVSIDAGAIDASTPIIDAAVVVDSGSSEPDSGAPPEPDAGPPSGDAGGFPGPLDECPGGASVDRFQSWLASGEGTTNPRTGTLLVNEGGEQVARVELVNREWHVLTVFTANQFEGEADFSGSSGFWLTYRATDDFYVQIRPSFAWSGGDKYLTRIPSTGGVDQTRFFSFARDQWTTLPSLGTPSYSYESALAAVRGFVFVGETPNAITFRGLRVDGYVPPCR